MNLQEQVTDFFQHMYEHGPREQRFEVLKGFAYSGWSLTERIDRQARILDVGCGDNFFKQHFPNLTGIDPASNRADFKLALEDFHTTEQFDAILCLGSIQHGDISRIRVQIAHICSMLRPLGKIYWRSNTSPNPSNPSLFIWTPELYSKLAEEFNCDLVACYEDRSGNRPLRLYAEWVKH